MARSVWDADRKGGSTGRRRLGSGACSETTASGWRITWSRRSAQSCAWSAPVRRLAAWRARVWFVVSNAHSRHHGQHHLHHPPCVRRAARRCTHAADDQRTHRSGTGAACREPDLFVLDVSPVPYRTSLFRPTQSCRRRRYRIRHHGHLCCKDLVRSRTCRGKAAGGAHARGEGCVLRCNRKVCRIHIGSRMGVQSSGVITQERRSHIAPSLPRLCDLATRPRRCHRTKDDQVPSRASPRAQASCRGGKHPGHITVASGRVGRCVLQPRAVRKGESKGGSVSASLASRGIPSSCVRVCRGDTGTVSLLWQRTCDETVCRSTSWHRTLLGASHPALVPCIHTTL